MKVPFSVISGISPKKTSCSLMSRMVLWPDGDFQRSGVGHAALLALGHIIFKLQADGIAAAVAEGNNIFIECSAAMAEHIT
jgi:hypothetical protein